jgi:hypothetical protein
MFSRDWLGSASEGCARGVGTCEPAAMSEKQNAHWLLPAGAVLRFWIFPICRLADLNKQESALITACAFSTSQVTLNAHARPRAPRIAITLAIACSVIENLASQCHRLRVHNLARLTEHLFRAGTQVPAVSPRTAQRSNCSTSVTLALCRRGDALRVDQGAAAIQTRKVSTGE